MLRVDLLRRWRIRHRHRDHHTIDREAGIMRAVGAFERHECLRAEIVKCKCLRCSRRAEDFFSRYWSESKAAWTSAACLAV